MNFTGEFNPYLILKQIYDNLKEYDKFVEILKKLKALVPNDPSVDKLIESYSNLAAQQKVEIPPQNK